MLQEVGNRKHKKDENRNLGAFKSKIKFETNNRKKNRKLNLIKKALQKILTKDLGTREKIQYKNK